MVSVMKMNTTGLAAIRPALWVVAMLVVAAACAGVQAREHALIPAMAAAWSGDGGVSGDALIGGADVAAVDAMSVALASGDRFAVALVDFSGLSVAAAHGIDLRYARGDVGLSGRESLVNRLGLFSDSYWKVVEGLR